MNDKIKLISCRKGVIIKMIKRFDSEERFKKRLASGLNIFTGAGFSVEAKNTEGKNFPIGQGLLNELKEIFPQIQSFPDLSKASTVLEATCKEEFYKFLTERFKVGEYKEEYNVLAQINIENIYTTNIDNLIYEIFKDSKDKYINTTTIEGVPFQQGAAVNYSPLHGCVLHPEKGYIFSKTKIASAFTDQKDDWNNLRSIMSNRPILFWGWSFEDSDAIEALYSGKMNSNSNSEKWILLHNPEEYEIAFYNALDFKIIIGSTIDLLERILFHNKDNYEETKENAFHLKEYSIPQSESQIASYPLVSFFEGDAPRWSYIYSGSLSKTHYYSVISDCIDRDKDTFVIGIPACGKTTLMMQLLYEYQTSKPKHFLCSPTMSEINLYLNRLDGKKSILFIDEGFRDYNVVVKLLQQSNVQLICFDRDYIYESQVYRIRKITNNFEICDITEINDLDARKIIDSIPAEIRKKDTTISNYDKTIFSILTKNMRNQRFEIRFGKMVNEFYHTNPIATELFVMICYVHACGVPVSFDMIYSYMRDITDDYRKMQQYINEIGKIIIQCGDGSFKFLNVNFDEQDYYQSRSRYFAELIIRNLPSSTGILKKVLVTFVNNVPSFKICRFDIFKRNAFSADYTIKAFANIDEGCNYYEKCALIDDTEYIYQQAALYLGKKKKYSLAFKWIERARNFAFFNRFSIDNTHAIIQFSANINIEDDNDNGVMNLLEQSLRILQNCYKGDQRKVIHVNTFADLTKQFYERFGYEKSAEYISQAIEWLEKEKNSTDCGTKIKKEMAKVYSELLQIMNANE